MINAKLPNCNKMKPNLSNEAKIDQNKLKPNTSKKIKIGNIYQVVKFY